jgi:hypothetical protein
MALVLLLVGLIGALASWWTPGSTSVRSNGLSGPQSLLLGLASLVLSSIVFSLANINQRLARIEAKLDSLGRRSGPENQPAE